MRIKERLSRINQAFVGRGARNLDAEDLARLLTDKKTLLERVRGSRHLAPYLDQARTLVSLLSDYRAGRYTRIPFKAVAALAFAGLYVLNPMDLIPDFLAGVGFLDDAAVMGLVMRSVSDELDRYRQWAGSDKEGGQRRNTASAREEVS